MNIDLSLFKNDENFYKGVKTLFNTLNIPVNYIDEKPIAPNDILSNTFKSDNEAYSLMDDVFILGMVDDNAFEGVNNHKLEDIKNQKKDYDGVLIFAVTLKTRENNHLPTRSQLGELTRAFNREFYYTPVAVVFKYSGFISLANAERLKYKQEWREGEKAGKVSILRDIDINNPHTGHLKILEELTITRSGKKGINSFDDLYKYWQDVFSVSLLSKKFYKELSNWYFWAIKHVTFPSEPTIHSFFTETGSNDNNKFEAEVQQLKAQNVIRLLTRLLFVWFIKEKKLIPEELFDLDSLQKDILKMISPLHDEGGLFKEANKESIYYKAILQNLFFATLNCPIKPDNIDSRKRGFRIDNKENKTQKSDFGVLFLMRYKKYFKNPEAFLEMVNSTVPFLNGGLFECLDIRGEGEKKEDRVYIDGFSENIPKGKTLVVPDYLFFGKDESVDLSDDYGVKNKGTKEASVKGLINILKSYKFTIAENTPIEEDVALDPELLGKVFENLLASYNPETKTTARKQTGSFYTPREIVNYMVDESLIAHLKNSIDWEIEEIELDKQLHQLVSFDSINPFENNSKLLKKIIHSLDSCKILDPACGSGAFPMGILQKMVHILTKVDPDNEYWQDLQLDKAQQETKGVFAIKDKEEREQRLLEINEAFDERVNNPDYARKLFLIENCIYGVDIQPIAAQISKLRFFISLVVEQKVNNEKANFGIRPLPNLETRFVTANTLIRIDKPDSELFYTKEVQEKESELKTIRHKLFGAKTKATKVKYRQKDKELRNEIADILQRDGLPVDSAKQLAAWDPYDQNGVSPFFDSEWMFDIKNGFDIVIANPPYISNKDMHRLKMQNEIKLYNDKYISAKAGNYDIYILFIENGLKQLSKLGTLSYIIPNKFLIAKYSKMILNYIYNTYTFENISDFSHANIFDEASVYPIVINLQNRLSKNCITNRKNMIYDGYPIIDNFEKWNYIDHSPVREKGSLIEIIFNKIENIKRPKSVIKYSPGINGFQFTNYGKCITEGLIKKESKQIVTTGAIDPFEILEKPVKYKGKYYDNPYIYYDSEVISEGKWNLFCSPKIVVAGMTKKIEAMLDENGEFAPAVSVYSIISEVNLLKHILAIISSTLIDWYFKKKFQDKHLAGGYISINTKLLEKIPIREPIKALDITLSCDKLLKFKKEKNIDTIDIVAEIDAKVAIMYGLTVDEYKYILDDVGSSKSLTDKAILVFQELETNEY